MTKSKTPAAVTAGILSGTEVVVDFSKMIDKQQAFLNEARHQAGSKPDKTDQAYIEKHTAKLNDLEDIVRSWIYEAFGREPNIAQSMAYWHSIQKNYNITVLIEKK